MLAILIFSWIVPVLLVLLAERNNGYSSSLRHDENIKRIIIDYIAGQTDKFFLNECELYLE